MRRLVLALPVVFLALSLDRVSPERTDPPAEGIAATWLSAAESMPGLNEGRFGRPGDPFNVSFLATPQALRAALTDAGWTEVPTSVRGSLFEGAREFFAGKPVASFPPMNDYRLRGRLQTMNWAMPVRFLQERHHFRVWRLGMTDGSGRSYWWGAANYDLRVRWRDLSHVPDPDADKERDFLASTMVRSPRLRGVYILPVPQVPRRTFNDKGYEYRTDGRVAVFDLR